MRRIYLGYADVSEEKQNDKQREMKIDDASTKSPKNWPIKKYFDEKKAFIRLFAD